MTCGWGLGEEEVVDQAGGPDPGGERDQGSGNGDLDRQEGLRIDGGDVVDAQFGLLAENLRGLLNQLCATALAGSSEPLDGGKRATEDERLGAFGGAEVLVAAAEGEAIGVADDGAGDDLEVEVQVTNH